MFADIFRGVFAILATVVSLEAVFYERGKYKERMFDIRDMDAHHSLWARQVKSDPAILNQAINVTEITCKSLASLPTTTNKDGYTAAKKKQAAACCKATLECLNEFKAGPVNQSVVAELYYVHGCIDRTLEAPTSSLPSSGIRPFQ